MKRLSLVAMSCCLVGWLGSGCLAEQTAGMVAEWRFDEGQGDVAGDTTGHHRDAQLRGATWAEQGGGFAVALDGQGQYVDGPSPKGLGITGPVSVEAWVKPIRKGHGESHLLGSGMSSFVLTYYNAELCYWYIGSGGNNVRGQLALGQWNHVVGTFDGTTISLWVNGRLAGSRASKITEYPVGDLFHMGSSGKEAGSRFTGGIDHVRVYNRPLSGREVVAHFKREAAEYGFDQTWFRRVKLTPYAYLSDGEVVLEVNYRGLQPLEGKSAMEVTLASTNSPDHLLHRQVIDALPKAGEIEVQVPCSNLPAGDYQVQLTLTDQQGARPVEKFGFSYPVKPTELPSPEATQVGPLPVPPGPAPFGFSMNQAGGFELEINGQKYPYQTKISWPHGQFNYLGGSGQGEANWRVEVQSPGDSEGGPSSTCQAHAQGDHYTVDRQVEVFATHVSVKDTYTNTTDDDLGLLIYNEMPVKPGQITASKLGGYEGPTRASSEASAEIFSPSTFVQDANTGIGIVPIDDVFVVQCVLYAEAEAAGVGTEWFALGPGKSYTLEWAVYPTVSGDYYDFVNAFRKVEDRIGTIDGALGFISYGPMNRRQVPDEPFLEDRGLKYGILHCLSRAADDPEVSIEGIEFSDFPLEMQLLKGQAAAFHRKYPARKIMFHVAHSLYMTNEPDRFADSKVIGSDGSHAIWGASEPYVSQQRMDEGWTWYVYYPVPGNSFHDGLINSVDVMMDDLGMDGVFMDGFLAGYMGQWSYDGRWDGHSAEIDLATQTIRRKMASVLLMSQPSLIEFSRKIRDKGGVVVANNTMMTRSIANEKYIIFDQEVASGPHLHFGPSVTALGRPPFHSDKDIYLDTLDKLSWGELFIYYQDRFDLSGPTLASKQYPMTFEEIRAGMVRGPERIVTMNSGVYGWADDQRLHAVHAFDARGKMISNPYMTTVGPEGVRTELVFSDNESAVVEPIPVRLEAERPVNVTVLSSSHDALTVLLNGQGLAELQMFVGTSYPEYGHKILVDGGVNPGAAGVGDPFRVEIDGTETILEERDGTLTVPLDLAGPAQVVIERADPGSR